MEDKITVFNVKSYESFWGNASPFKMHFDETEMKVEFGYDLDSDVSDVSPNVINLYKYDSRVNPDVVILHDRVNTLKCWKKLRKQGLLNKSVFLLNESSAVDWKCGSFYLRHFRSTFPVLLTYRDDYVNGCDVLKTYVVGYRIKGIELSQNAFGERRLLCAVCAKKKSHFRHEMYSERLKNIEYFEKHPEVEFDLYGAWWGEKYNNWRGMVPNKRDVYHNHKFALCIENAKEMGYITEKVFDCFRFGIVPIYAGPQNVNEYLPEGSFIDYYQFKNPEHMIRFLKEMSEEEFGKYLDAARGYILSDKLEKIYNKREIIEKCVRSIRISSKKISSFKIALVGVIDSTFSYSRLLIDHILSLKKIWRRVSG